MTEPFYFALGFANSASSTLTLCSTFVTAMLNVCTEDEPLIRNGTWTPSTCR